MNLSFESSSLLNETKTSMKSSFCSNLSISFSSKKFNSSTKNRKPAKKSKKEIFETLIEQTVTCLREYDKHRESESTHLEKFSKMSKKYFTFLKEVFEGVLLNWELLSGLVDLFLEKSKNPKKEKDRLLVISYLLLFRFEDMKLTELCGIFLSQKVLLMHLFLKFLLSKSDLLELVFPQLETTFDCSYLGNSHLIVYYVVLVLAIHITSLFF